jgi:hypothetical protein
MNDDAIDKIIEEHELWLNYGGDVGKKANFHGLKQKVFAFVNEKLLRIFRRMYPHPVPENRGTAPSLFHRYPL